MDEDKLTKQFTEFAAVAKENPNVDVGLLMATALQNQKQNQVSPKAKKWAYLISISVPPVGLFFALKYFFFSEEDDATGVAWMCITLTALCLFIYWIGGKLFSGSGTNLQQIQQIKPSDIQQLTQ